VASTVAGLPKDRILGLLSPQTPAPFKSVTLAISNTTQSGWLNPRARLDAIGHRHYVDCSTLLSVLSKPANLTHLGTGQ